MKSFQHILVSSENLEIEIDALKQALSLARNNNAALAAFMMYPELPKSMANFLETFEKTLKTQIESSIADIRKSLDIEENCFPISLNVEKGELTAARIIQQALRQDHDLVIKDAQAVSRGKGYKAIDMDLMRKCACPVWLCRPINNHRQDIRVAVAIDPNSHEAAGHQLSIDLLQKARNLADTCSGQLDIVSCWNFRYESYMRSSAFAKLDETLVNAEVAAAEKTHLNELKALIKEAGIEGSIQIHHLKGKPDEQIPEFVEQNAIDILVMGTVARTGIPGFLIGNTAENIVQNLSCSLLAMKPNGFKSPIEAY